jgi:hypothetical protein
MMVLPLFLVACDVTVEDPIEDDNDNGGGSNGGGSNGGGSNGGGSNGGGSNGGGSNGGGSNGGGSNGGGGDEGGGDEGGGDEGGGDEGIQELDFIEAYAFNAAVYCQGYADCDPTNFYDTYASVSDCELQAADYAAEVFAEYGYAITDYCVYALLDYADCLEVSGACYDGEYGTEFGDYYGNCEAASDALYEECPF